MYKVGDKVRIREWDDMAKEFGTYSCGIDAPFGFVGDMRKYCGEEFTISSNRERRRGLVVYRLSGAEDYMFSEEMFVKSTTTITEHLIRGNKIIVKLSNGRVGVAKCNPEDQFDILYGTSLATLRAYKGKDANIEKRVTYCVSEEKQNKK